MNDSVTYEGKDLETLAATPRYQGWIVEHFRPFIAGRTAEIGAGVGSISSLLLPHTSELHLVEPSPPLVHKLGARFESDSRVRVSGQTMEAYLHSAEPGSRDTVVLVNVLEHIEDDVAALRGLYRTLSPGGHLLLFVPAMPLLFSKLDAFYGHHRRYTRRTIVDRLGEAGFELRHIRYLDVLGILPWYLINTLGGQTEFNPFLVRMYDMIGVPLTKLAERLIRPPIGKNLLAIARKPKPAQGPSS